MKNIVYFLVVVMLFMITACSNIGQFDASGNMVRNPSDKVILAGFVNYDSTSSFTLSLWRRNGYRRDYAIRDEIILPDNLSVHLLTGGEYGISTKKATGSSYENTIIFWDEGSFIVNKKKVDVKIDLMDVWKKSGGGSGKKYNF